MLIAGNVYQPTPTPDNTGNSSGTTARLGRYSDLIVSEFMGRSHEATFRKLRFGGANQAGVTMSAAFATTYTGLVLTNPIGSGVLISLDKVGMATVVIQTSELALGLMTGYSSATAVTQTTPITPKSKLVGLAAGQGLLAGAATLSATPTLDTLLGYIGTSLSVDANPMFFDLGGDIVLQPGAFAAIYASAASAAASLLFSMAWTEVAYTS